MFDLWVQASRQRHATGDIIVVRYADDIVRGFQAKSDADRLWAELAERFRRFHLELHPEKTRLLELGPSASDPIPAVGTWLRAVVGGHIRYYGVPTNSHALHIFRFQVGHLWHRTLARRSQNGRIRWDRMRRLIDRWLPPARICHPTLCGDLASSPKARAGCGKPARPDLWRR